MHKGQIDKFLNLLERAVMVAERWANAEFPIPDENAEGEIYRFGDKQEPQSPEEYSRLENQEGRFAKRYREAHPED